MMILFFVMAMCCFSCISSSALTAGIGGSVGPIASFLDAQNQQNDLQSIGTVGEIVGQMCDRCEANSWEGTTLESGGSPCSDLDRQTMCVDQGFLA
jgi:hypothetical protein